MCERKGRDCVWIYLCWGPLQPLGQLYVPLLSSQDNLQPQLPGLTLSSAPQALHSSHPSHSSHTDLRHIKMLRFSLSSYLLLLYSTLLLAFKIKTNTLVHNTSASMNQGSKFWKILTLYLTFVFQGYGDQICKDFFWWIVRKIAFTYIFKPESEPVTLADYCSCGACIFVWLKRRGNSCLSLAGSVIIHQCRGLRVTLRLHEQTHTHRAAPAFLQMTSHVSEKTGTTGWKDWFV